MTLVLEPDGYYELRSMKLEFSGKDVEPPGKFSLARGDIILCAGFCQRSGERGRGGYARLLHRHEGRDFVLFYRTSRNRIGNSEWRAVNPMIVIAIADQIPTL